MAHSQLCLGYSVSDIGDLVEVIFAFVILYRFEFSVGSHFVVLVRIFSPRYLSQLAIFVFRYPLSLLDRTYGSYIPVVSYLI